jgi:hypothetical protein
MNLNRMLRWAAGQPMFSTWINPDDSKPYLQPSGPLRVLIIENEGAGPLFHRQIGIMKNAEGFLTPEDRKLVGENVLIWGEGGWSDLKLDDTNKLNMVRSGCEKWKPDIVYVEPFRSLWKGEENSATEMATVVDALVGIANDYRCCVIVAHHERKSGAGEDGEKMSAGRGSTVLEGAVTVMENFESIKNGDFRELSWSKSRHGRAPTPVRMEWVPDAWWYRHIPLDDVEQIVLNCLQENSDEPMTVSQIMQETEEKMVKVREMLRRLVEKGRVKKLPAEGREGARYRLPTDDLRDGHGGLGI